MGYYLQGPITGKVEHLKLKYGAIGIKEPDELFSVESNEAIICVVENLHFEAAAFAFSQDELEVFKEPCGRNKTWLTMNWDIASKDSGYDEYLTAQKGVTND